MRYDYMGSLVGGMHGCLGQVFFLCVLGREFKNTKIF
jgi:hypothetical protein